MSLNPYNLMDDDSYQQWKKAKLARSYISNEAAIVNIENPFDVSPEDIKAILEACDRNNFVIYQSLHNDSGDKYQVHALGQQLGLQHLDDNLRADEDSVTSLEVRNQVGNQYIPYTNKALSWHCDGYYNTLDRQIRGIIMHCASPAEQGGENELLDHELLYIKLRDENPEFIKALMRSDVMTIPANIENGVEIRAEQSGPVFLVDALSGQLHMRYSARKRNIQWKDNDITVQVRDMITELLSDSSIIYRHTLKAGQGIVCNNVLHNRTSFEDSDKNKRLMFRARYYDRVKSSMRNEK